MDNSITSDTPSFTFYLVSRQCSVRQSSFAISLSAANGIYQNSVFGMAAKLPTKYTGAVVLGSVNANLWFLGNVCTSRYNTLVLFSESERNVYSLNQLLFPIHGAECPNCCDILLHNGSFHSPRLLWYVLRASHKRKSCSFLISSTETLRINACRLQRFYRYRELLHQKGVSKRQLENKATGKQDTPPYWKIFRQCFPQLFNTFFVFFITLALFPAVQSDIQRADPDFVISKEYYTTVMCFLTFNTTALIGSSIASLIQWVGRMLWSEELIKAAANFGETRRIGEINNN